MSTSTTCCLPARSSSSTRRSAPQPNHPQQPVSPPWTRDVGGNGCRSCGRRRQSFEGSSSLQTEPQFTCIWDRRSASGCSPVARLGMTRTFTCMCVRASGDIPYGLCAISRGLPAYHRSMKILPCLIATVAAVCAASGELVVTETLEISKVPSGFPVGFSLLTSPGRQYAAYYDADHNMMVAARPLDSADWVYQKLPSKIAWDSHNYITMALDSAGGLHVSGNMHCVPLVYFRTAKPGDITSLRPAEMTGLLRTTSPTRAFSKTMRGGSSSPIGTADRATASTSTTAMMWKPKRGRACSTRRSSMARGNATPIPPGPPAGRTDGSMSTGSGEHANCATNQHLSTPAAAISFIGSPPLVTGSICRSGSVRPRWWWIRSPGGGIINGGHRMEFDSDGKPVFVYHKSDADGNMQILAARPQDGKWQRRALTKWNHPSPSVATAPCRSSASALAALKNQAPMSSPSATATRTTGRAPCHSTHGRWEC